MQEIEVKYRVLDPTAIAEALALKGIRLSMAVEQDDQAFAPTGWEYGHSKVGVPFARLRTQDGRHLFTVKRPVDNEMSCVEHETEVADRDAMHAAIVAMGFYPTVRIRKTRRTAGVGEVSVCVDQVAGLGCFLEVEKLVGTGESGREVQRELDEFVQLLGIAVERTHETYDSLIRDLANAV